MEDKRVISVISENGNEESVEVVTAFKLNDTNQDYIVYTQNEKDDNNNITVYVSKIIEEDGVSKLAGIESDEEWTRIKSVLRELSKEN